MRDVAPSRLRHVITITASGRLHQGRRSGQSTLLLNRPPTRADKLVGPGQPQRLAGRAQMPTLPIDRPLDVATLSRPTKGRRIPLLQNKAPHEVVHVDDDLQRYSSCQL